MKICSRCKLELPVECFSLKRKSQDGLASRCKDCMRKIQWVIRYKITPEEYMALYMKQEGKCAICHGKQDPRYEYFAVDHDHRNGEVRGLLCQNCNVLIGYAKDDIVILRSAITYLERV